MLEERLFDVKFFVPQIGLKFCKRAQRNLLKRFNSVQFAILTKTLAVLSAFRFRWLIKSILFQIFGALRYKLADSSKAQNHSLVKKLSACVIFVKVFSPNTIAEIASLYIFMSGYARCLIIRDSLARGMRDILKRE